MFEPFVHHYIRQSHRLLNKSVGAAVISIGILEVPALVPKVEIYI